jgi:hypothetical protein
MNPCPFCNSTHVEVVYYNRPCVVCRNCGACGPASKEMIYFGPRDQASFKAEAIELWNTRPGNGELIPKTAKTKAATKEASQEGLKWADWFRSLLPQEINLGASWRNRWGLCFDALFDIDKRNEKDVIDVCMWARHDGFWMKNFLSPLKLRQRDPHGILYFDKLLMLMNADKRPEVRPTLGRPSNGAPQL